MTRYQIFSKVNIRKAATPQSEKLGELDPPTEIEGTELPSGYIQTNIPSISADDVFVLKAGNAAPILVAPIPFGPANAEALCALVTASARDASTDRDYLLAVAYALTNSLANPVSADGKKVGPFQFTAEDWKAAITTGPAKGLGLQEQERFRWHLQPAVSALVTADNVRQFKQEVGKLPKFRELFFFELLGAPALKALKEPNKACADFIVKPATPGTYAAELEANLHTVKDELDALQDRLDKAYADALKVIEQQPPEIRFFRAVQGDAPWMAVARQEMASGVSEDQDKRNTAQIKAYFTEVGSSDDSGKTPWCGAFVGHCMLKCGVPEVAAKVTPNVVGTKFWESWGVEAADPLRVGTVVVIRPNGTGGHVGFLAEGSSATVTKLLGGNQGGGGGVNPDHVGIVDFPVANNPIVTRRWMDTVKSIHAERLATDDLFVAKAPVVMKQLMDALPRLKDFHAAAILGNIGQECGGFTQLRQRNAQGKELAEGEGGGYGWCQWDDRSKAFRAFATRMGVDWRSDAANLGYLIEELKTTENPAFELLLDETSLEPAVITFDRKFERSGKPMTENRIRYAKLALKIFSEQA